MSKKLSLTKQPLKFRSGFEKKVYEAAPHPLEYEPNRHLSYNIPAKYIPDFVLPNGIHVECKGYFNARDRAKMCRVARSNPKIDIRMVFQRANNRITKSPNSMTYWQWAEKHGFIWHEGYIPEDWWN